MHQVWCMLLAAASATRLESFNAGLRASQTGDADAALSHFQAAVKADGDLGKDDVSLHLALGEALSRAGAHAEAAQHLQQALDLCHEHELGDKVRGPPRPRQPAHSITLSCTPHRTAHLHVHKVYGAVEYNLAVAVEDAGGEQADARAEKLYRSAAAHGLSQGLYNLAVLVVRGRGRGRVRVGAPTLTLTLPLSLLTLTLTLTRCSWASGPRRMRQRSRRRSA